MDGTRITVRVDPPAEFWRPIEEGLRAFNESRVGALPKRRALALQAHDASGALLGGALGWLSVGWLYIDMVWIEERHRHTGLGTNAPGEKEQIDYFMRKDLRPAPR